MRIRGWLIFIPTASCGAPATSKLVFPAGGRSTGCTLAEKFPPDHIQFCCPSGMWPETGGLPPNRTPCLATPAIAVPSSRRRKEGRTERAQRSQRSSVVVPSQLSLEFLIHGEPALDFNSGHSRRHFRNIPRRIRMRQAPRRFTHLLQPPRITQQRRNRLRQPDSLEL